MAEVEKKQAWGAFNAFLAAIAGGLGVKLVFTLMGFVNAALLVRLLTPKEYGVYSIFIVLVGLATTFSSMGLPLLVTREASKFHSMKMYGGIKDVVKWSNSVIAVTSIILFLSSCLFVYSSWDYYDYEEYGMMAIIAAFVVPVASLTLVRSGLVRGCSRAVLSLFPDNFVKPTSFFLLLLFYFVFVKEFNTETALFFYFSSSLIAMFFAFYWSSKVLKKESEGLFLRVDLPQSTHWLKSLVPLGLVVAIQLLMNQIDIIMVGYYIGPEQVAYYRVAVLLSGGLGILGQVVNNYQAPRIAFLYQKKETVKIKKEAMRAQILATIMTALGFVAIYLFGEFFIEKLFGPDYVAAYVPALVLGFGYISLALTISSAPILYMTGREKAVAKSVGFFCVVNIFLNAVLVPKYGLLGASGSTCFSMILWRLYLCFLASKVIEEKVAYA